MSKLIRILKKKKRNKKKEKERKRKIRKVGTQMNVYRKIID